MIAVFFNLLANSTFSLLVGLIVVGFFLWLFRVETGPWKIFLLSLPFAKIVYDVLRGLPPDSVLLAGLDPYVLPPRHQLLQVGAGFNTWGPVFNVNFTVKDLNGAEYAASAGDYLVVWLNRNFGDHIPLIVVTVVFAVAFTLFAIRFLQALKFEVRRRSDRKQAESFIVIKQGPRKIDVYISNAFSGTPFTGGVFKPYICIPRDSFSQLSKEEIEAVIAHERGHIRQFDLVVTMLIQLLGDLFWFIPGYRALSRKIDRMREIVADQWAVKSGVEPAFLASALVKLKGIPENSDRFVLYSAFCRKRSLLKQRVEILLSKNEEKRGRFGWNNKLIRAIAAFWIFMSVMGSTLIANHATVFHNPVWFDQILDIFGF